MQDNPQDEIAIDDAPRRPRQTLVQDPKDAEDFDEPRAAAPLARRETQDERQQPRLVTPAQPAAIVSMELTIMRHSETIGAIGAALAAAQGDFKTVIKTEDATITSRREGARSYSYRYETLADVLDVIRGPMSKNGIAYLQFPHTGREMFTCRTMFVHSSGEWIYNDLRAILTTLNPQDVGIAASYLRRYALKSLAGVASADEDTDAVTSGMRDEYEDEQRRDPPRPAAQRRQTREQSAPATPTKKETPTPAETAQAQPESKGEVHEVVPIGTSGAVVVRLKTGYQAATKDPELAAAALKLKPGTLVELAADAPKNPNNHKILREIVPLQS